MVVRVESFERSRVRYLGQGEEAAMIKADIGVAQREGD